MTWSVRSGMISQFSPPSWERPKPPHSQGAFGARNSGLRSQTMLRGRQCRKLKLDHTRPCDFRIEDEGVGGIAPHIGHRGVGAEPGVAAVGAGLQADIVIEHEHVLRVEGIDDQVIRGRHVRPAACASGSRRPCRYSRGSTSSRRRACECCGRSRSCSRCSDRWAPPSCRANRNRRAGRTRCSRGPRSGPSRPGAGRPGRSLCTTSQVCPPSVVLRIPENVSAWPRPDTQPSERHVGGGRVSRTARQGSEPRLVGPLRMLRQVSGMIDVLRRFPAPPTARCAPRLRRRRGRPSVPRLPSANR